MMPNDDLNLVAEAPWEQPRQQLCAIAALRPTQITVGMREVRVKRERWRHKHRHNPARFLERHTHRLLWDRIAFSI